MSATSETPSLYRQYVDGLAELALAGRPDPLKDVFQHRLRGDSAPCHGLTPPPLERHEPDLNAVLQMAYYRLRDAGEEAPVAQLRRCACELLMEGLGSGRDLPYLRRAARLVGHFRVIDSEDLRLLLHQQLYGFLASGLERPFPELILLEGEGLERATIAIDVWLSITPVKPGWQRHHRSSVRTLFDKSLQFFEKKKHLPLLPRLELLTLIFRALVKVDPKYAGCHSFWGMSKLIQQYNSESRRIRRHWLATCRHQGVLFADDEDWRAEFLDGLVCFADEEPFLSGEHERLPIFAAAVERLDGVWNDAERIWKRRRRRRSAPPRERIPLRLVAGGSG